MEKKKKKIFQLEPLPEKHPLEEIPEISNEQVIAEEDMDKIQGEEEENFLPEEPPAPGEGP